MKRTLALMLLAALLLSACSAPGSGTRPLTLWFLESDPAADSLIRLTADYERERPRGAASVTLRSFSDGETLERALAGGIRPDLLYCGHALAFLLYGQGSLSAVSVSSPGWPDWLSARSPCVGESFFPIGFSLPLLCTADAPASSLADLAERAAAYGRETGEAYLGVDAFAPLFYQSLLDAGVEFHADPARDELEERYRELFNALAEAAFDRGLTSSLRGDLPCLLCDPSLLRSFALEGRSVAPLSGGELLAEGHGLAVCSDRPREAARFLSWLLRPDRLVETALSAGLVPAVRTELSPADPLEAALAGLAGRPMHLPDPGSPYLRGRESFESFFTDALALLH